MSGPAAFEVLIADFAQLFSSINPAQVPAMLAQLHVPKGTPFKNWLLDIQVVVVSAMDMGSFSPGLSPIQGNLNACLASQYPSILLHFGSILDLPYCSIAQVWDIFEGAKDNLTAAETARHVSATPSIRSCQRHTANSKLRVMTVSENRFHSLMDNSTSYYEHGGGGHTHTSEPLLVCNCRRGNYFFRIDPYS